MPIENGRLPGFRSVADMAPAEWARFAVQAGLEATAELTVLEDLDRLRRELTP